MINLIADEVDLNGEKYTGVGCNIGVLNANEASVDRFPLALVPSPVDGNAVPGLLHVSGF